jgi:hypothetical protein
MSSDFAYHALRKELRQRLSGPAAMGAGLDAQLRALRDEAEQLLRDEAERLVRKRGGG